MFSSNQSNQYFFHINHFQPGINHIQAAISSFAEDEYKLLYLLIIVGIILYCLFLISVIFILYRKFVMIQSFELICIETRSIVLINTRMSNELSIKRQERD